MCKTAKYSQQQQHSLHKHEYEKNSYHHFMLWSLALGHHWQHYFPIFPFTSQPLLTYSSASGCLWIARRYIFWNVFKYLPPHLTASPHILISYKGYFWISRVTDQRSLVKQPLFTYSSASGYLWILWRDTLFRHWQHSNRHNNHGSTMWWSVENYQSLGKWPSSVGWSD